MAFAELLFPLWMLIDYEGRPPRIEHEDAKHILNKGVLMRYLIGVALIFVLGLALTSARADSPTTDRWFLRATSFDTPGTVHEMARPDFLCGKSFETINCHLKQSGHPPNFYGVWELLRYDRKHQIAFARANTDQETFAIFRAPVPPVSVPDADLSQSSTGRGLHIGSPYPQVLSTYGPPVKHGRHFVTSYSATFPATDKLLHRRETLHERITLVVDDDYVSSIAIYIDCCNG